MAALAGLDPSLLDPPFKKRPDLIWADALKGIEMLLPPAQSPPEPVDTTIAKITANAGYADRGIFNDRGLQLFGKYMFTFINPVFGDVDVAKHIQELYPDPSYNIVHKSVSTDGEGGVHWYLASKHHPGTYRCSVAGCTIPGDMCTVRERPDGDPLQWYGDGGRDANDTLCQSYTVLAYMERPLKKWKPVISRTPVRLPPRIQVTGNPDRYEPATEHGLSVPHVAKSTEEPRARFCPARPRPRVYAIVSRGTTVHLCRRI